MATYATYTLTTGGIRRLKASQIWLLTDLAANNGGVLTNTLPVINGPVPGVPNAIFVAVPNALYATGATYIIASTPSFTMVGNTPSGGYWTPAPNFPATLSNNSNNGTVIGGPSMQTQLPTLAITSQATTSTITINNSAAYPYLSGILEIVLSHWGNTGAISLPTNFSNESILVLVNAGDANGVIQSQQQYFNHVTLLPNPPVGLLAGQFSTMVVPFKFYPQPNPAQNRNFIVQIQVIQGAAPTTYVFGSITAYLYINSIPN